MKKWGYHSYPPAENTDMAVLGIEDALAALGLSTKMQRNDGPVQPLNFVHEDREQKDENGDPVPREKQTYVVDGRTYKMTRALCQMMVDHEGGAIYTSYRVAAYNAAKRMWRPRVADPPKDQLPKLRSMSDLMYAGWIWDDGVPAAKWKEIKYLFSNQITNADTNEVIMRVLKSKGMKDLPQWPGVTFPITDVEGQALLGTPNAVGYGYLLAQHKDQLGNKCVTKITAFEKRGDAHMLLYVEDCVAKDPLEKSLQHGGAGEGKEVMGVVTTVDLGDGTGISPIEQ
ncbi:hypothetical protein K504DRAFT_136464 [Pleomassaria siparia CBS 279.74]|uniref:Uncharacterized protein n=1 Tax=Pleomassaria siparia CBS 279.74 TaxID=1314801 RepID=A0A6G1KLM5_9PLEO|nr:hypothetical protein K504DRAFT_136464 [Pleomassaria siparia CBS 279.74]